MGYTDKVFLILVETEENNFMAKVYTEDEVKDSFENLAKSSDGKKNRATLIELNYGSDSVEIEANAKLLPQRPKKAKQGGYKLGDGS